MAYVTEAIMINKKNKTKKVKEHDWLRHGQFNAFNFLYIEQKFNDNFNVNNIIDDFEYLILIGY